MKTNCNSLLRVGNKIHTTSFLRCREVLQEKKIGQKNANNYSAAKGQQMWVNLPTFVVELPKCTE
tara:strand:+ start:125 stop:319 length:195 start_codon:yes stop_codon:yes gene_type:complete